MMQEKSKAEKERILKRWCFAPGTKAWTADFTCILKTAYFKLQVLTVSDHRSRFLLHSSLYLNTSTEIVMKDLEELFIKFGKPDILKADNGPEFRIELRDQLKDFAVYLVNSPGYYGQFNGAHERIHRKLKEFIDQFSRHQNLTRLVAQIQEFVEQYNYQMPMDSLGGKTPADIFLSEDEDFTPAGAEVVTPYEKDGELKMKFTDRDGNPARISVPSINQE
jgi:transposase InsO family protein